MPHSQRQRIVSLGSRHHRDYLRLLPAELVSEIICHFISDETTLVTCQQISKAFQYPARKKLFYEVSIDFPTRTKTGSLKTPLSLYMKVARFPDIAKLIHRVVIYIGPDYTTGPNTRDLGWEGIENRQRSSLLKTIPLLTSLKALKFPQCRLSPRILNVAKKGTRDLFFPIMTPARASKITELDISALKGSQFPSFSQLAMFHNLERLTLDLEDPQELPLALLEPIGGLDIKESINLILSTAFPFDIPWTGTVDFDQSNKKRILQGGDGILSQTNLNFTGLTKLLLSCKNLTEFRFGPCPLEIYPFSTFKRLRSFSNLISPPSISGLKLEKIVLRGKICYIGLVNPGTSMLPACIARSRGSPLGWIIKLFETVKPDAPIPLQEVKLDLVFANDQYKDLLELLTHQWEEFRGVLMSSRFPQLKKVYIRTRYEDGPSVDGKDNKFPELSHPALDAMQKAGLLTYGF